MIDCIRFVVIRDPEVRGVGVANSPTRIHEDRESATTEAVRLASAHPGVPFFVASLVGFAELPIPEATFKELPEPPEDDIPF